MTKPSDKTTDYRLKLLLVVFFVIGFIFSVRLFQIQILKHDYYTNIASGQHNFDKEIIQNRGEIFMHGFKDEDLVPVVTNRQLSLVYAVPSQVDRPQNIAETMARLFETDEEKIELLQQQIYEKVKKENDPYEPLQHKVDYKTVEQIQLHNFNGIYFEDQWERYYPEKEACAHISGFWGYGQQGRLGQYGIEGLFDRELQGRKGFLSAAKDIYGRIIPIDIGSQTEAEDGNNIVLTIDKVIQSKAYEIIKQATVDYGAVDGSIIVMNPITGAVKAMANFPSFDPNNYGDIDSIEILSDKNISLSYEPGSVFKIITMAAGLDSEAVEVDDTFFDAGSIKIGEHTIRNADNEKFGKINMTEILENSVNTGAVNIALKTGRKTFLDYVTEFGFGQAIGHGFFNQSAGDISSLNNRGDIYLATASYGQGITITPLQMATAMSTVVNGGYSVTPSLIEYIETPDKQRLYMAPEPTKNVISPDTSMVLKAMLVSVVKNGHGSQAQVPGYYIGGKTGTAEIAHPDSPGYSDENIHSFAGFGPMSSPKFVIMVKLTKPKWGRFSAVTAAPTFAKMASFLLQYYQIPPEY